MAVIAAFLAGCNEGKSGTEQGTTLRRSTVPRTDETEDYEQAGSDETEEDNNHSADFLINKRLNDGKVEDHVSDGLLQTFVPWEYVEDGTLEIEGGEAMDTVGSELGYLGSAETVVSDDHAIRTILIDERIEHVDDTYMDVALLGLNRNGGENYSWKDIVASTIHENLDTAVIELESTPRKVKGSLESSGEKVRNDQNGLLVKDTIEIGGEEYWWAGGMLPGYSAVVAAVERPADGRLGTPSFDYNWGGTLPNDEGNNAVDFVESGLRGLRGQYDVTKSSEYLKAIGDLAEDGSYNSGSGFPILMRWTLEGDGNGVALPLRLYDIDEEGRFVNRLARISPELEEDYGFHEDNPIDYRADFEAMGDFIED